MPESHLADTVARIAPPGDDPDHAAATAAADERWRTRAKPPGSLGRLEPLAAHVAGVTGTCPPAVPRRPAVVVFAGDHGVVADGASAWAGEVTAAMVRTMAAGRAAVNAFAATVGAHVVLVDVGVDGDLSELPGVVHDKVRAGTASLAAGPAMTRDEALAAVDVGLRHAATLAADGSDLLVGGDMGIGNTTASTVLVAHAVRARPADALALVGRGAGVTGDGFDRKRAIVADAVERVAGLHDPVDVLAAVGGLEIAALAGFHLGAVAAGVPVIVDGLISCAALCVADALAPGTAGRVIAGHRSTEPAAAAALAHLGLEPLLDLDLRLGEGTGAVLAVPLVQAACRALGDLAELPDPRSS